MQKRYIEGKSLPQIQIKPTLDSDLWKTLIAEKESKESLLDCRANYTAILKLGTKIRNLGGITEAITGVRSHKDQLSKGILSKMPKTFL